MKSRRDALYIGACQEPGGAPEQCTPCTCAPYGSGPPLQEQAACGKQFSVCERDRAAIVFADSIGNCKMLFAPSMSCRALWEYLLYLSAGGEQECLGLN